MCWRAGTHASQAGLAPATRIIMVCHLQCIQKLFFDDRSLGCKKWRDKGRWQWLRKVTATVVPLAAGDTFDQISDSSHRNPPSPSFTSKSHINQGLKAQKAPSLPVGDSRTPASVAVVQRHKNQTSPYGEHSFVNFTNPPKRGVLSKGWVLV